MKRQLVIRTVDAELSATSKIEWGLFEDQQLVDNGRSRLAALSEQALLEEDDLETIVLVPGELVLLTQVEIPSKQLRQIKQALPFMVEEGIADEIEEVHLAIPNQIDRESFHVDVAVVRHLLLINWLDVFYEHNLQPGFIAPDSLFIPWDTNRWSILPDGDRVLIRRGMHHVQVIQSSHFGAIAPSLVAEIDGELASSVDILSVESDEAQQQAAAALQKQLQQHNLNTEVQQTVYKESLFELLATTALRQLDASINLRQGGYKVQAKRNAEPQQWARAATVAGIGLVAYLVAAIGSGAYFNWQADQLDAEATALYRDYFPDERRVVSPRKQMESHLRRAGQGGGPSFVALLAQTAKPLADGDKLALNQMRFAADRNDLRIEIRAPNIEALDELKQALNNQGLAVNINSATEKNDAFLGNLVIEGG